ncbi:(d)CMP kinase [Aurantimicrobium minutum]|uniref:(d)CMP kinase n=1 Tax=Aurantimicrobium minutum TaxID=708131 RepID=UPI002476A523|nr:(d)CMP kinase [Aurantimicrobium minutum]MDH6422745.1 cytidylate kinase [Aurantimicrobium minutum]
MSAPIIVAVDGPAGSGKSSVSKAAARKLDFAYLDTGAAYRAVAWHVLNTGTNPEDEQAVIDSLEEFGYEIGTDPDNYFVKVNETDITDAIREVRITDVVSKVAKIPVVRQYLGDLFRHIMASTSKSGIIAEGRDITTVVAPDAPARILLTASEEARMARRSAELPQQSQDQTASALRARDAADSRVSDFMTAADGVVTVDSTDFTYEQTIDAVVEVIRSRTS